MSTFKMSILISHLSYKAKAFDKSFKGIKNVHYQYYKSFICGENFDKKIFFPGSVFENKIVKQISNHTNRSATMKT